MHDVLPVIFFGHGNPMNAVQHNGYTEGWRSIGKQTQKAPRHLVDLCALVCSRNRRNSQHRAKDDP